MKTLIGIVTFGNLPFTQLTLRSIRETTRNAFDFFVIVGKPGDLATKGWLEAEGIPCLAHEINRGFAASINDIYEWAWGDLPWTGGYDNVIIAGNDIVPYPGAVDRLIDLARETDWEWLCSSQFDAKSLVARYPEARRYFTGENLVFTDFAAAPWALHEPARLQEIANRRSEIGGGDAEVEPDCIKDVRNLTLFKRSVFDKIGYADVNFWPGGYFEDNDYCTRARLAGVRACGVPDSAYFHFWSRTIHQGGKGGEHHAQFRANERYYASKWGGGFEKEAWALPFQGKAAATDAKQRPGFQTLKNGKAEIVLPAALKIADRDQEAAVIDFWSRGGV